jgi:hypothetical protein
LLVFITPCFITWCYGQEPKIKPYVEFTSRASQIDPRTKAYPQIDFLLEKEGKPADIQHACRPSGVASKGKLVVWFMGHSPELFHFLADEGFHVLRVHYANGWFNRFGKEPPPEDRFCFGSMAKTPKVAGANTCKDPKSVILQRKIRRSHGSE